MHFSKLTNHLPCVSVPSVCHHSIVVYLRVEALPNNSGHLNQLNTSTLSPAFVAAAFHAFVTIPAALPWFVCLGDLWLPVSNLGIWVAACFFSVPRSSLMELIRLVREIPVSV